MNKGRRHLPVSNEIQMSTILFVYFLRLLPISFVYFSVKAEDTQAISTTSYSTDNQHNFIIRGSPAFLVSRKDLKYPQIDNKSEIKQDVEEVRVDFICSLLF